MRIFGALQYLRPQNANQAIPIDTTEKIYYGIIYGFLSMASLAIIFSRVI